MRPLQRSGLQRSGLQRSGLLVICLALASCGGDDRSAESDAGTPDVATPDSAATDTLADAAPLACDAEPVLRKTPAGVEFVRTPNACFEGLPDWPFAPRYVELDGLRQAYVDEGPKSGPVVLLLHGQPSWSYLYRKMIPVLVKSGYRVIAMDHLGTGRSDKPTDIASYSYLGHGDRLKRFIEALDLREINLFAQDWGSLIGLRVAGLNPERFARIAIGNGSLPVLPQGLQLFPPVENPEELEELKAPFEDIPAQQLPFYDGCKRLVPQTSYFGDWMKYAMKAKSFRPSRVVEALTWFDLPPPEEAAYDAPFPGRIYMAGVRVFPSLINDVPGVNDQAWAGLAAFDKPFLTLWASNDPGAQGSCEAQLLLASGVPGAAGQPHDRLPNASHFLQEDQGPVIAERLVDFFGSEPLKPLGRGDRYCEILLLRLQGLTFFAEVWGTQGISDCPDAAWKALDPKQIQADTGALAVIMNGPRHWIPNAVKGSLVTLGRKKFGALEMHNIATVQVDPTKTAPYTEQLVDRATTYTFNKGEEIYELTSPPGDVYVMQSMSLVIDPTQKLADLPLLGARLTLPTGWTYTARTLTADLVLKIDKTAIVLQDDLGNTYQQKQ